MSTHRYDLASQAFCGAWEDTLFLTFSRVGLSRSGTRVKTLYEFETGLLGAKRISDLAG